jgi:branched-chain amino acid transport system permease protein
MNDILLFCLLGLGSGALLAGLALSVVVSYRGSGSINLAVGAFAMVGAYTFYDLRNGFLWLPPLPLAPHRIDVGGPMSAVPAFLVSLLVCALLGALLDVAVFRRLRTASPLAKVVASLGVLLTIQAIIVLRFGTGGQSAPSVWPVSFSDPVNVLGTAVPADRFIFAGIVLAATLALIALYRYSRFGLTTRAAAENETVATLLGLSPNTLSLVNSILACVLCGAVGILAAPLAQLDPTTLTLAVIPALGAALLARFTSFGTAAAAGFGMGMIASLVTYAQTKSWFPKADGSPIPGVTELIFFLIVIAASFWRSGSLPERGQIAERRLPAAPKARRVAASTAMVSGACVAGLLLLPFDLRQALIFTMLGTAVCLSIVVVTGFVGQVSLMQVALAGVSGLVVSKLAVNAGIGFPFGPIIAVVAATAFGVMAALPALRVRGMSLVIVTLAATVALERFGYDNPWWGGGISGSPFSDPHLLSLNIGPKAGFFGIGGGTPPSPLFGLEVFAVVLALCLLVVRLRRSSLGSQMLAVRSNERAAAALGISVQRTKIIGFAISSAIAACAGVLYAYNLGSVSVERFDVVNALALLAFAYLGGITTVSGAIVGGLLLTDGLSSYAAKDWLGIPSQYQLVIGGLALIVTVATNPQGMAGTVGQQLSSWRGARLRRLGTGPGGRPGDIRHGTDDTWPTVNVSTERLP